MNLAQRILEISDSTRDQAKESVEITGVMDVIQEISAKTSKGSSMRLANTVNGFSAHVNPFL